MKKYLLFLLVCCFGITLATERVRSLKAYDGSFKKLPIDSAAWQNFSETALFEWQEPLGDIKEYAFYFGKNTQGAPKKTTQKTSFKTDKLTDGIYYFRVQAVDINNAKSEIRSIQIKYDKTPLANNLRLNTYANSKKTQVLASNTPQQISNKPYFKFDTSKIDIKGAPIKGLNIYWGPDAQGIPNKHIKESEMKIYRAVPGNQTFYLRANIEDEAGNISETKELFKFIFSGETPTSPEKPDMSITNREISVDDQTEKTTEVFPGSQITYTISLSNMGKADAYNVELKDVIPANTTCLVGSAKSDKPAIIEYWDELLNGNKGAWTSAPDTNNNKISKIRWTFTEKFTPASNKKTQANISYSVKVNQ